jgi:hypothetical protein
MAASDEEVFRELIDELRGEDHRIEVFKEWVSVPLRDRRR